jgi:(S)-sulfolactate dehydrogenase
MPQHDIIITEFIDDEAVADLGRDFRVHYDPKLVDKPRELAALGADVPALIVRNRTQVRGDVLAACRQLEVIGRLGVGLDNIDMDECTRRGIKVFPATGANTVSVAEYVIAATLVALRDVWHANDAVLAGKWPRNDLMLNEASGKCMGLVGFGAIARAVAVRARAIGMSVMAFDPLLAEGDPAWRAHETTRAATLEALLAAADVVSLHAPLLPATRNLIDATALKRMRPSAVIVNSARGGLIDEHAMADALKAGTIKAAVLDVYDREPLPAGSHLLGVPRLYLTPHIAGVTAEANVRVSAVTVAAVRKALHGGTRGS